MERPSEAAYNHTDGTSVSANSNLEITEGSEFEENQMAVTASTGDNGMRMESTCEIEELEEGGLSSDRPQVYAKQPSGQDADDVYVAVGKSDSSMEALSWALKNVAKPGSFVYLIHVFPEVQQIPTPLGHMAKDKLSKDQVDNYMNQEREKRRQMLQKYINLCRTSKVEYDVHLIESNQTENAILELIPVLNIKNLVIGTSKSNLRRLKRGGTKAGIIQKNAPLYCEVKIICEGKDISTITTTPDQTPPPASLGSENAKTKRRELTPSPSLPQEIQSMSGNGGSNPRKKRNFKNLFRYFSCRTGNDVL
ncbi:U-box domain-containing protein [Rhynchospora pubera]|uniref:U-box domain-containing protein n=1 Tax=Rhynchospora pubera TaxID=906938 RepID=A0AAV8HP73_9POAL|nr:U-box domain-containing protein [Rhynchospora pubera]KAJ4792811.1 U-box domain-containing protein [Rhynchospora pubera]KAJ4816632.1 U-box domain-containing protein [Rhynchospora pubera]